MDSADKIKISYHTALLTQHHSFFRNLPIYSCVTKLIRVVINFKCFFSGIFFLITITFKLLVLAVLFVFVLSLLPYTEFDNVLNGAYFV